MFTVSTTQAWKFWPLFSLIPSCTYSYPVPGWFCSTIVWNPSLDFFPLLLHYRFPFWLHLSPVLSWSFAPPRPGSIWFRDLSITVSTDPYTSLSFQYWLLLNQEEKSHIFLPALFYTYTLRWKPSNNWQMLLRSLNFFFSFRFLYNFLCA